MNHNVAEKIAPLSVSQRKRILPMIITKIVMDAKITENYQNNKFAVLITFDGNKDILWKGDFDLALQVAIQIRKEWKNQLSIPLNSPSRILDALELATTLLNRHTDYRQDKKGIVMLSDNDGCGYWRMRLPAKYMTGKHWYADITSGLVNYEALLEYDTIYVQRFHEWDAFYVLEKLKSAGKKIVYDIDDDLWAIPKNSPAAQKIQADQQQAAIATLKLADTITTTTEYLQQRLYKDFKLDKCPIIIPNALPMEDLLPVDLCGSPDGKQRIFWQGGTTHAEDWEVCIQAVEQILSERENVLLTIIGFLPPVVLDIVNRRGWQNRVEYMGFSAPETYYQMAKHFRAEVAICPLKNDYFNQAKSNLKWLEAIWCGMPTIVSGVEPYKNIVHTRNGLVCKDNTPQEWYDNIIRILDDKAFGKSLLTQARNEVIREYNIANTAKDWEKVLCS